ncbi:MAG: sulfite exporter TauE/SafE family protein [Mariprofundaceae bacterium]
MSISLWLFAPLIGLLLSLFAAGGGLVAVPLLNAGLGMPLKEAIAGSLIIVASISFMALFQKGRWKLIQWRLHRFFAFGALAGGFAGGSVGLEISDTSQATLFAAMVLFIAWWIHSRPMKRLSVSAKVGECKCHYSLLAGFGTGMVTGLIGVGGGFIIVPVLMMLGITNHQTAVAHSLLLIVSSSLVAASRYYQFLDTEWTPLLIIALLAGVGVWIGSLIADKISSSRLQKAFSLVLCLLASWMLVRMHLFADF